MDKDKELTRQTSYIIAIHNASDNFAVENSVEEAMAYVEKFPTRKAVLVADGYRNPNLEKIAYNQVQTFKKGTLRIVDKKLNENKIEVLQTVCSNIKNGLVVIHNHPVNAEFINEVLYKELKGQDIIIHRNQIVLHDEEVNYINKQIQNIEYYEKEGKAFVPQKAMYFRLHAMDKFSFSTENLIKLIETFGQELGFILYLGQFILMRKSQEFIRILQKECIDSGEKFDDFIDPYVLKQETSNFLYINILKQNIVGADPQFIEMCHQEIVKMLQKEQK